MPKVCGKNKGNSFERDVSRTLSLWWSDNQRDDLFWRTQSSGGRFTIRKKKDVETHNQQGDITATHPDGEDFIKKFYIECKSYKDINIWSLITGSHGKIVEWWEKASIEATECGKIPMLIVKENRKPVIVFTSECFSEFMFAYFSMRPTILTKINGDFVSIFKFDDLMAVPSKDIKILFDRLYTQRIEASNDLQEN